MTAATPRVTIVTATYHRPEVLRHAIRSVLESTYTDWELMVVGDGCTDETEQCVASFNEPRIRFENLPRHTGGQSAPNNRAVELARGSYIAFLNHDDLYLPQHLASCVSELDAGTADLVWVPTFIIRPDAGVELGGVPLTDEYTPFAFYVASSWVLRRELTVRIGPWPSEGSVFVTPSQAWLFRAWRSGARLRFMAKPGVVVLYAGFRDGSYARRACPEHDAIASSLKEDPAFLERLYASAAIDGSRATIRQAFDVPLKALCRALAYPIYALLIALGVHPRALNMFLRFGRPGGCIRQHRRAAGVR